MPFVINANKLDDGAVVYLTTGDTWVADINKAMVLDEFKPSLEKAATHEQNNTVVGIYEVEIKQENNKNIPTEYREYIRAKGPSIRYN